MHPPRVMSCGLAATHGALWLCLALPSMAQMPPMALTCQLCACWPPSASLLMGMGGTQGPFLVAWGPISPLGAHELCAPQVPGAQHCARWPYTAPCGRWHGAGQHAGCCARTGTVRRQHKAWIEQSWRGAGGAEDAGRENRLLFCSAVPVGSATLLLRSCLAANTAARRGHWDAAGGGAGWCGSG